MMSKQKPRKFADGGFTDLTNSVKPMTGQSLTISPNSKSGGAYGGLDTVNQGSQQIGQSLADISGALGKPGGGQAGGVFSDSNPLSDMKNILGGTAMKKGGAVKTKKSYKSGGSVKSSASKRGDGCASKGHTKGKMISMKSGGAC